MTGQRELRRAEAAVWGPRPEAERERPRMRLVSWKAHRNQAGTMLGFLSAQLPSGIIINDMRLMLGPNGRHWIAMPSIKQLDQTGAPRLDSNGKAIWSDHVEFKDKE